MEFLMVVLKDLTGTLMDTWLVVSTYTPLKNMSSSVGMMKFQIYGNVKNVPNHQTGRIGGVE